MIQVRHWEAKKAVGVGGSTRDLKGVASVEKKEGESRVRGFKRGKKREQQDLRQ